ncbi:MAG: hypothetical protein WCT12_28540, partial [Verrucomicrobiota bacterium]
MPGGISNHEIHETHEKRTTLNAQNTASAGFQPDTNLNTLCSLVAGKMVSVALSSSNILAATGATGGNGGNRDGWPENADVRFRQWQIYFSVISVSSCS